MKLICPVCQADFPIEAALNDATAREAIVSAFELTDLGSPLIRYMGLFKPAKRQAISFPRLAALLKELIPMIKDGQITRGGTLYPAPRDYWQMALETMLLQKDKLSLPLKSHGYLLEIIAGYANKAAGQTEKQTEQGRKYGPIQQAVKPVLPIVVATPKKEKSTPPKNWRSQVKKGLRDEPTND
jgi:hypothetical protein